MKEDLRYITEHMSTKRRLVKSKEKKKNLEMQRRLDEMEQTEALLTEQSVMNHKDKKLLDLQEVLSQYSEPMKQHIAIKMEQKQPETKGDAKDLLKAYEEKGQDTQPVRLGKQRSEIADE